MNKLLQIIVFLNLNAIYVCPTYSYISSYIYNLNHEDLVSKKQSKPSTSLATCRGNREKFRSFQQQKESLTSTLSHERANLDTDKPYLDSSIFSLQEPSNTCI